MAFKAAVCPSCAGELQVPDNRDLVKCMYCGSDIIVREVLRTGASVNIDNILNLARSAEKSGNYEDAYKYFSQVLEHDMQNVEAWFGRGTAAGWQSTSDNFRIQEMITCYEHAMQYTTDDTKKKLTEKSADSVKLLALGYFKLVKGELVEFINLDDSWPEYLDRAFLVLEALKKAGEYSPNNKDIIENSIVIAEDMLEGEEYYDEYEEKKMRLLVSDDTEEELKEIIGENVARLQVLDPSYRKKISKSWWSFK